MAFIYHRIGWTELEDSIKFVEMQPRIQSACRSARALTKNLTAFFLSENTDTLPRACSAIKKPRLLGGVFFC